MKALEVLHQNYLKCRVLAQYYRTEVESFLVKNYQKFMMVKDVWKSRFWALLWLIGLFWSIPISIGIGAILWSSNWWQGTLVDVTDFIIAKEDRKTVLISGASCKGLFLARVMGQAGHKVIIADQDMTEGLNLTRFSRYVKKFIPLKAYLNHAESLLQIYEAEKIDWFIPVSKNVEGDVEAAYKMEQDAALKGRDFNSLSLDNNTLSHHDDKLPFWIDCKDMGLNVPDFKKLSDIPFSDLTMFREQGLFQDPDQSYVLNAMPNVPIPHNEEQFDDYVNTFLSQTSIAMLSKSYILHEFIHGQKFIVNLICKNGNILVMQISPTNGLASSLRASTTSLSRPWNNVGIENWIQTYVQGKNLSGMVSIDLTIDKLTNEVYGTDFRPYLHNSILSFNDKPQMVAMERVLRRAMESRPSFIPSEVEIVVTKQPTPLSLGKSSKEIFWLFHEVENLILERGRNFDSFVDLLTSRGQDAVWSLDDPLPFYALHYLQMPLLFGQAIYYGHIWNQIDFSLQQDLLAYNQ